MKVTTCSIQTLFLFLCTLSLGAEVSSEVMTAEELYEKAFADIGEIVQDEEFSFYLVTESRRRFVDSNDLGDVVKEHDQVTKLIWPDLSNLIKIVPGKNKIFTEKHFVFVGYLVLNINSKNEIFALCKLADGRIVLSDENGFILGNSDEIKNGVVEIIRSNTTDLLMRK